MKKNYKITNATLVDMGPIVIDRRKKNKYRILKFTDLDDGVEYKLTIVNGHRGASRFEKLPVGAKLCKVVVFSENGTWYVDGNSNFSVIKATPLF
jgi:hypothetical protein